MAMEQRPNAAGRPESKSFSCCVKNTHWVFPKRVLCGHSAGLMRDEELRMLVEMGINTFVCLQTSYVEYGVRDYRHVLRQMYQHSGVPGSVSIRFLHCPIEDFLCRKFLSNLVNRRVSARSER